MSHAAVVFFANATASRVVRFVVNAYVIVLIARALLSWFPLTPGSPLVTIVRVLDRLCEPVLAPIRRLLPPVRAGGMAIDLSIIVAILAIEIIGNIVASYV
ncbi:MAG TPA: YggT family protein [Acidimicrobiales bacterium]|nr:YggT family protein [Acidimicrobiales bacterium]